MKIDKGEVLLVHICCSVDSHFFLQKLQKLYPDKKLRGFFYDPNIHPYSEYQLRLLDVKRSCTKLGIELLEGAYDYEGWMQAVRGLENEPEKGKRCSVCFDDRLKKTALKALELGESEISTTLLTSPKKSIEQLRANASKIEQKYGLHVRTPDFRIGGGTSEQFALAKEDKLYHQNYCGCLFALQVQRQNQQRLLDELMCPISKQILPSSIEERIELYTQVMQCENKNEAFVLRREKFLNYRLLRGLVRDENKRVIPSHILFYSLLPKGFSKGKIEYINDGIGYFSKDEIIFLHVRKLNELLLTTYKSIQELSKTPPSISQELALRRELSHEGFLSLGAIIILDEVEKKRFEVSINAKTYHDVREILVKVR